MAKYKDINGNIIEVGNPELNPELIAGKEIVTNQPTTSSPFGVPTINSTSLSPQAPINLPVRPVPQPLDIVSGQATIDSVTNSLAEIQKQTDELRKQEIARVPAPVPAETADTSFMASIREQFGLLPKQESTADLYQKTYGISPEQARISEQTAQADSNTKRAALNAAKGKFGGISARLAGITAEAQAIEIRAQKEAEGRGITTSGQSPITTGKLRENALRAIPLQAEALVAQAEVAQASGELDLSQSILEQAGNRIDDFFKAQIADSKNEFDYKIKVFDEVRKSVNKKEEKIIDQKKSELTNNNSLFNSFIDDVRSSAKEATANSQGSLSGQFSSLVATLDPSSKTFKEDFKNAQNSFAQLQGQIKGKTQNQIIGSSEAGYTNVITDANGNVISTKSISGGTSGNNPPNPYKFTSTNFADGSANAGLDLTTFKTLLDDVQNIFINNKDVAQLLVDDVASLKDGSMSYDEAVDDINSQGVPQSVKDYFMGLLGEKPAEEEGGGFWDWIGGLFK